MGLYLVSGLIGIVCGALSVATYELVFYRFFKEDYYAKKRYPRKRSHTIILVTLLLTPTILLYLGANFFRLEMADAVFVGTWFITLTVWREHLISSRKPAPTK